MPTEIDGAINGKIFRLAAMSLASADLDLLGPRNKALSTTQGPNADKYRRSHHWEHLSTSGMSGGRGRAKGPNGSEYSTPTVGLVVLVGKIGITADAAAAVAAATAAAAHPGGRCKAPRAQLGHN